MDLVTSILHHQHWGLPILWWLNWQTPLTIQGLALTLDDLAQGVWSHLCGPIFRVLIWQPLRPISFHSLIKLLPAGCNPKNPDYSALDNTTLILSWGAASIDQYSPYICLFLIQFASYTPTLRYIGVCLTFFANALAAASISHKVSLDVFWFFNCERKMSVSAKKCVLLNLSLMGCFGHIDSTSFTHSGSWTLSSTLSCLSVSFSNFFLWFSDVKRYLVSRTVFLTFFYGFLMLFWSLPQLDASQSGKWMPTTVRQFLFAPVILLSLASPRTFSYPHLP